MWLLILEAGIALGLLVFIVWWTMAPVKKREDAQLRKREQQLPPPPSIDAEADKDARDR